MDGIGIQFLNGIDDRQDVQFLDGKAKRRYRRAFIAKMTPDKRKEFLRQTQGITTQVSDDIHTVVNGLDLAGFTGLSVIDDDELAYNYLNRTKQVVEKSPQTIAGYDNPEQFSQMLGYVLSNWDTPNREAAINRVAREEQKLIQVGSIQPQTGDHELFSTDESYNLSDYHVDKNGLGGFRKSEKNGFFSNLKRATTASTNDDINHFVGTNPFLANPKRKIRKTTAENRQLIDVPVTFYDGNDGNNDGNDKFFSKIIQQNKAKKSDVLGLCGFSDESYLKEYVAVERGHDLAGLFGDFTTAYEDLSGFRNYLIRTRNLLESRPTDYFSSEKEANINIKGLNHIIAGFDSPDLREKHINEVASYNKLLGNPDIELPVSEFAVGLGSIFSKIGKAIKKGAQAVAKGVKNAVKAVAKVAKKVGKAIVKVAKKVWKVILKFNPLTLMARSGLLLAIRLNMFHLASKSYVGSITQEDAIKLGYTKDQWEKANAGYKKFAKLYTNIGGSESTLKSTIKNGAKKLWKGKESPSGDKKEIDELTEQAKIENPEEIQEAVNDYDSSHAELAKKGAVEDSQVDPNAGVIETKEEITVNENIEVDAYHDENGNLVDKDGKKLENATLKGIDVDTAIAVYGVINNSESNNLGVLPAVLVSSAVPVITAGLKILDAAGVKGISKAVKVADAVNTSYSAFQTVKTAIESNTDNNNVATQASTGNKTIDTILQTKTGNKTIDTILKKGSDIVTKYSPVVNVAENIYKKTTENNSKNSDDSISYNNDDVNNQKIQELKNQIPEQKTTESGLTIPLIAGAIGLAGIIYYFTNKDYEDEH